MCFIFTVFLIKILIFRSILSQIKLSLVKSVCVYMYTQIST